MQSKTFVPSKYQAAIFDFITTGTGDAVVNAVAGSGKSTTLVQGAKLVQGSCLFLAFNRDIVADLKDKLAGTNVEAKTINSLGFAAVSKVLGSNIKIEANKYRTLVQDLTKGRPSNDLDRYNKALVLLVSYAQSNLTNVASDEAIAELASHYGLDLTRTMFADLRTILAQGERMAREAKIISFDDQIWLPALWKIIPRFRYDFVFVDECQDLSFAKLQLVLSATKPGGRRLFVGDPRQAIYGFAGADAKSFANIITQTNATELPLAVSYRCPLAVIELLKTLRGLDHVEAAPSAKDGAVNTIAEATLADTVREGDLLLCRLTAPLIRTCLQLIAKRIPARVKGRDIGKAIAALIRGVAKQYSIVSLEHFPKALDHYTNAQVGKLVAKGNQETKITALTDKVEGIYAMFEVSHADTVEGLCIEIESLFSDEKALVELSTIHRAKGLEANNVFILRPETLPLVWKGQQDWELSQEFNLQYVAYTRAKDTLTFVTSPPSTKKGA